MSTPVDQHLLKTFSILDEEVIASLRDIMDDDFIDLIQTFLGDSEIRMQALRDATARGEPDTIRKAAHSFKGSSGNIGARRLSELCRQLEELMSAGRPADLQDFLFELERQHQELVAQLRPLTDVAAG